MKKTFFTKDPSFYRSFFKLMTVIALQNLVAYSVNMLDNIMLGSYSQNALIKDNGITMAHVLIIFMTIENLASPPPRIIPMLTGI